MLALRRVKVMLTAIEYMKIMLLFTTFAEKDNSIQVIIYPQVLVLILIVQDHTQVKLDLSTVRDLLPSSLVFPHSLNEVIQLCQTPDVEPRGAAALLLLNHWQCFGISSTNILKA